MNKERYLIWKYWDSVQKKGERILNNTVGFGFDDILETSYYKYTANAINNPVNNGFGIIETVKFGSYIKQTITFATGNTGAGAKVRQMIRMRWPRPQGSGKPSIPTWSAWREVTLTDVT